MAELHDLSTELLLNIYELLDSIDDALHLARGSKHLHAVYETHRSDTTPDSSRPSIEVFEQCCNATKITRVQVWDIVARWQGLRAFQHLYVDSKVNAKFSRGPPDNSEILNVVDLVEKGECAVRNIDETKIRLSFSSAAIVRFYKALTNYWLATEARKLADQCAYTLQSSSLNMWDRVHNIFDDRSGLQESLDVLEVYDFGEFLCQHIDHADKDSLDHWLNEQDWFMGDDLHVDNRYFIIQLGAHLSPPDILELLFLTSVWKKDGDGHRRAWSKEKRRAYLQARGSFDSFTGRHLVLDVGGELRDTNFAIEYVEGACMLQLQETFPKIIPKDIAVAWKQYRGTLWLSQIRGQFGSMSSGPCLAYFTEVFESLEDNGLAQL
ncbi:uncharacterized protein N0V89_004554 [Didymosphaeria variabile]|uniref:F-box domain-containing protein n=1 Tax=Didymosphaeria variabile TaxID=1932322 RepID=A0A9W8XPN4_9PLEO|nr:uncharacterized protein N0V89_004554 [Didymosphaeria variabile]KAJ4356520.1 hypothetical protein N0V89_004554 [Didymosphaeria variabile]